MIALIFISIKNASPAPFYLWLSDDSLRISKASLD